MYKMHTSENGLSTKYVIAVWTIPAGIKTVMISDMPAKIMVTARDTRLPQQSGFN